MRGRSPAISHSFASGAVSVTAEQNALHVGGLVGIYRGTITSSGAAGNIHVEGGNFNAVIVQSTVVDLNGGYSSRMVGGLVGGSFVCCGGSSRILNSYSTGTVTATAKDDVLFVGGSVG